MLPYFRTQKLAVLRVPWHHLDRMHELGRAATVPPADLTEGLDVEPQEADDGWVPQTIIAEARVDEGGAPMFYGLGVDKREVGAYLVRWEGAPAEEDWTWEEVEAFHAKPGAEAVVTAWEAKNIPPIAPAKMYHHAWRPISGRVARRVKTCPASQTGCPDCSPSDMHKWPTLEAYKFHGTGLKTGRGR